MYKKFIAFTSGLALIAIATVAPVFAAADLTPTASVGVASFIEFSLNISGDCNTTAGGDCPFGTAGKASEVSLDNSAAYAYSYSTAQTTLTIRTNATAGVTVAAYATNDGNTSHCLDNVTGDVIPDTIVDLVTAQGANELTTPDTDTKTGLGFRLLLAGTDVTEFRGTDEDTQWGATDVAGVARWAAFPVLLANDETIFDSTVENVVNKSAVITYFAGVDTTQAAGDYSCTINYTIASN